jgi:hypothetical protein
VIGPEGIVLGNIGFDARRALSARSIAIDRSG